ncbi:MAG: xanthan lyase [Pirellulaceae bacterium]|nr:MAG: xanthan lyase [Pirellulaceae bacterium]GIX00853.1 MAG: xanthan lyase [Pirellulaceae bacterium]GIX01006.1 MAG: xanthan lyase [Pirellulaceae bacterium]
MMSPTFDLRTILLRLIGMVATCGWMSIAVGQAPSGVELFEARIRPALIEYCLDCHSTETEASGGLALDSRVGWQRGGDSGPAIRPGNLEDSLLWRAISYRDPHLQMPPDGKLPATVLRDFARWIEEGATDPRAMAKEPADRPSRGLPVERAAEHWAYRPLTRPQVPGGAANPIDAFVYAKLRELEIPAAGPAAPHVLVRRLYFDLTGLPPTPGEIRRGVAMISDGRIEELVDRLLASPRFGEHVGRRWLDVVRFAESITLRGFVLPEAWRYRDYVIEAFNEDRPFDVMICEQVAGDLMTATSVAQRQRQLIATALLAMGNTNLERQDKAQLEMDYIDEQLEVIGRAFLAQTLGCARCHDHKFDPIPTKDYYALAGILRSAVGLEHDNVSRWIERPLPLPPEEEQRYAELQERHDRLEQELKRLEKRLAAWGRPTTSSIDPATLAGVVVDSSQARLVGQWTASTFTKPFIADGYLHDGNAEKGRKTATFEPLGLRPGEYEVRLAYTAGSNRASRVPVRVFSANEQQTVYVDQRRPGAIGDLWVSLGEFFFEKDGLAYVMVSNEGTDGYVVVDAVQFLPVDRDEAAHGEAKGSGRTDSAQQQELASLTERQKVLQKELKELQNKLSSRPKCLTIEEKRPPQDIPIHIRGDVHNLGQTVPRGFLTALGPAQPQIPAHSSGRWELAQWIASEKNPLTARVYANRLWLWLIGSSLAGDPNNFGTTVEPPSHPELLDWLASQLVDHGWSTKWLVRQIVLSETYARSLQANTARTLEQDPANRFLWRANYKRLPVEAVRDAMLAVSGELDLTMYGSLIRPGTRADYNYVHEGTRRTVYHPVFRNALPPLLEAFDFADPSVSVGMRARSTVATQALVLLNDPWVHQRVEAAATRFHEQLGRQFGAGNNAAGHWVDAIYWHLLGRAPLEEESRVAVEFLTGGDRPMSKQRVQRLVHSLVASIDFRYLD